MYQNFDSNYLDNMNSVDNNIMVKFFYYYYYKSEDNIGHNLDILVSYMAFLYNNYRYYLYNTSRFICLFISLILLFFTIKSKNIFKYINKITIIIIINKNYN
jgi:hypothetical protein